MDTYRDEKFHFRSVNIYVCVSPTASAPQKGKFLKIERHIKTRAEPFHSCCLYVVRLQVNAQPRTFPSGSTALLIRTPSYRNAGCVW